MENGLCLFEEGELPVKIVWMKGLDIDILQDWAFSLRGPGLYPPLEVRLPESPGRETLARQIKEFNHGTDFSQYLLREKIGTGYYSVVYRCEHRATRLAFAAKVITLGSLTAEEKRLIKREISIMKALDHRNVIRLQETYRSSTEAVLVLELVPSYNLKHVVESAGRLDEGLARQVTRELVEALSYFRRIGLLHRDLKPENVIVVAQDSRLLRLKVIDFGLSVYEHEIGRLPLQERCVGTLNFMAP